jgi:hypothetical protein
LRPRTLRRYNAPVDPVMEEMVVAEGEVEEVEVEEVEVVVN